MKINDKINELTELLASQKDRDRSLVNSAKIQGADAITDAILSHFGFQCSEKFRNALIELVYNSRGSRKFIEEIVEHLTRLKSRYKTYGNEDEIVNHLKYLPREEIDLTEEDEAALDRAWDKMGVIWQAEKQNNENFLAKLLAIRNESSNFEKEFARIAEDLFRNAVLVKDFNTRYMLTELEFYYHSDFHPDDYIYKKEEQLTFGKFFRHGTGIDLTFGNKTNIYGGILIRGLYDLDKNSYVNGPWTVLKVLSDYNTKIAFEQLNKKVKIRPGSNNIDHIFLSTRFGLKEKSGDKDNYLERNYRFITGICPEHKYKEKTLAAVRTCEFGSMKKAEINHIFGYSIIK